jgi:hypothetical protein
MARSSGGRSTSASSYGFESSSFEAGPATEPAAAERRRDRGLSMLASSHELETPEADRAALDPSSLACREVTMVEIKEVLRLITSSCGPDEWLPTFAEPVRAQAAIDRFTSNAYDLVIKRLKPRSRSPWDGQKNGGSGN